MRYNTDYPYCRSILRSILSPRNTRSLAGINPGRRSPPGAIINSELGMRNSELWSALRAVFQKDHTKAKSQKFAFSLLITHLKYIREADSIIPNSAFRIHNLFFSFSRLFVFRRTKAQIKSRRPRQVSLIFDPLLKHRAASSPKNTAAAMPPAVADNPPVKAPMKPISSTALITP